MSARARPGIALLLVLWIIVILGAVGSGLALSTRAATAAAVNFRARTAGRYAAESGITVARAVFEQNLAARIEANARVDYLNRLDRALAGQEQGVLGDARYSVVLIDVNARLDVNLADTQALATLFGFFTDPIEAERSAGAILDYVGGAGPGVDLRARRPLASLDELERIPGLSHDLLDRVVPFLTVDGDGSINRVTATEPVLAAATGQLRDEPGRILLVSRGWLVGQPLTHEIQAVFAVVGNELVLVRWRERDL